MLYTPNLLLKLPETHEHVLVEDLNENFTKIDTEIAKITDEETGVEAKFIPHLGNMAMHNQFMDGSVKKQLVFGVNSTLNCLTINVVEVAG
ncbi:MAG: hypothetical protein ABS938_07900 [Psychrobacillus psychrodurans]